MRNVGLRTDFDGTDTVTYAFSRAVRLHCTKALCDLQPVGAVWQVRLLTRPELPDVACVLSVAVLRHVSAAEVLAVVVADHVQMSIGKSA